ncbi:MAG: (d)CMP kinase [Clostridium sp.]|nr:(d)CMP kinase [Clostridium sp.]
MNFSVAIDGPAGAGKSTIAKKIGDKFHLMYINTGAMYRAVTVFALRKKISNNDVPKLCTMIDKLNIHFKDDKILVNDEDLSDEITTPLISENVSNFAAVKEVRERLVLQQKKIAKQYDVIMDGRDIGTVVLKDANYKFYLTASSDTRAKRRYNELKDKGIQVEYDKILSDIIKRDYIDSHRELNPLKKAKDAIEIDSSDMNIDEVVNLISNYINKSTDKF